MTLHNVVVSRDVRFHERAQDHCREEKPLSMEDPVSNISVDLVPAHAEIPPPLDEPDNPSPSPLENRDNATGHPGNENVISEDHDASFGKSESFDRVIPEQRRSNRTRRPQSGALELSHLSP